MSRFSSVLVADMLYSSVLVAASIRLIVFFTALHFMYSNWTRTSHYTILYLVLCCIVLLVYYEMLSLFFVVYSMFSILCHILLFSTMPTHTYGPHTRTKGGREVIVEILVIIQVRIPLQITRTGPRKKEIRKK